MNILVRIIQKLIDKFDIYHFSPPYSYVQNIVENHLHNYLKMNSNEIFNLVIVGGYLGNEIPRFLRNYPALKIVVYEPSRRYASRLRERFQHESRVDVRNYAVSDQAGKAKFYETNLRGSGSLLKIGSGAAEYYGASQKEEFIVDSVCLDGEPLAGIIDCLWIDVQGAEMLVLNGARELLSRTRSVFIEVAKEPDLYKEAVTKSALEALLFKSGFELTFLGLDKEFFTGNAFFTKIIPLNQLKN